MSGVRAAVLAVAQGLADAVVSAGNTGATVTSAALGLGRWPGVRRPALAAVLPTAAGRLVLLDVGASVDPDEHTLAMHARLGAAYAVDRARRRRPPRRPAHHRHRAGQGRPAAPRAPAVLAGLDCPAGGRYVGLVEGNDVVTGATADVVVTDGFTGNVLLKGLETAYALLGAPHAGAGRAAARGHPARRRRHRRRLPRRRHRPGPRRRHRARRDLHRRAAVASRSADTASGPQNQEVLDEQ